jgi:transcriptional regulator of acetoin/glycerol metabolism
MDKSLLPTGVDRPDQAWDWMQQTGEAPTGNDWVRPEVAESWDRCLEDHNLHPRLDFARTPELLDSTERLTPTDWSRQLQTTLFVQTYNIHSFVQDVDMTVLLTDKNGTLMHVVGSGSNHFLSETKLLQLGSSWQESAIGNNGIGTAVLLGSPMAFIGKEHFFSKLHACATAGVPIKGPDGNVIAFLGLLSTQRDSLKPLLAFIRMAGIFVEAEVFNRHRPNGRLIRFRSVDAREGICAQQSAIDGLVVLGSDDLVQAVNVTAMDLLGMDAYSHIVGERLEYSLGIGISNLLRAQAKANGPIVVISVSGTRLLVEAEIIAGDHTVPVLTKAPIETNAIAKAGLKSNVMPPPPRKSATGGQDTILDSLLKKMVSLQEQKIPILIIGESGVGKEYLVQHSHRAGPRRDGPFIAINCAAIPRDLIESELFGYVPGSFTGASREGRVGKFQHASGGTIFLDEIGDMDFSLQATLLRVLESSEFVPVGGVKPIKVDVQVIAATNASLRDLVERGTFRRDLYYRLNGAQIWIPSLRERPDKIQLISSIFEQEQEFGGFTNRGKVLSDEVLEIFLKHPWPGNIRQLRNLLKTVAFLSTDSVITVEDLPPDFIAEMNVSTIDQYAFSDLPLAPEFSPATNVVAPVSGILANWEEQAVLSALQTSSWNVSMAAKKLNITRSTLYQKIAKYGIKKPSRSW